MSLLLTDLYNLTTRSTDGFTKFPPIIMHKLEISYHIFYSVYTSKIGS